MSAPFHALYPLPLRLNFFMTVIVTWHCMHLTVYTPIIYLLHQATWAQGLWMFCSPCSPVPKIDHNGCQAFNACLWTNPRYSFSVKYQWWLSLSFCWVLSVYYLINSPKSSIKTVFWFFCFYRWHIEWLWDFPKATQLQGGGGRILWQDIRSQSPWAGPSSLLPPRTS